MKEIASSVTELTLKDYEMSTEEMSKLLSSGHDFDIRISSSELRSAAKPDVIGNRHIFKLIASKLLVAYGVVRTRDCDMVVNQLVQDLAKRQGDISSYVVNSKRFAATAGMSFRFRKTNTPDESYDPLKHLKITSKVHPRTYVKDPNADNQTL